MRLTILKFAISFPLLVVVACSSFYLCAKQPNVVLIMADDLGFEAVESYGGRSYKPPNLTRLAQHGVQFNYAFATPLCTNTRTQLMTGKYQNRNWLAFGLLDPKETTFGHLMQEAGYNTAMAGKWQLQSYDNPDYPGAERRRGRGMRVEQAGFDEYSLYHVEDTETKGNRYSDPKIYQNGHYLKNTQGKYGPDIWYEFLADYMQRKKDDTKPFFVYYAMALPHAPFKPTPNSSEWSQPEKRHTKDLKYFKDMVEYGDLIVGKLIDKIDQLGIRENTIIIFYSDNGSQWNMLSDLNGTLVQGGKGLMTDLGTRVPMYVSWKGKTPEGRISHDLIDSTDFLPTLLDIAGRPELAAREKPDGVSFFPQIKGQTGKTRESIYMHQETRPGQQKERFSLERFARNQRYKLYQDGRLYEPSTDIYEENPVMPEKDSASTNAVRVKLQAVLDSMKPYPMYDPKDVPRAAAELIYKEKFLFDDFTACIVMEAEEVAYPRDESWLKQNKIPGFTGTGYIRALRDQLESPEKGKMRFGLNIASPGKWLIDIRHRHDHHDLNRENGFWMKIGDGDWKAYRSKTNTIATGWEFGIQDKMSTPDKTVISAEFRAGKQYVWIAPMYENFKIDRIVAYRSHREACAKDINTPQAGYHPWFNYNSN